MKQIPLIRFIPGITWFILVLVLICIPGQDIPQIDAWPLFLEKIHFDKLVHGGMFGVMMILFSFPFRNTALTLSKKKSIYLLITLLTCFWGLATECIQLFVPMRSFDLIDWAADSLGAAIGFYYMYLFPTK